MSKQLSAYLNGHGSISGDLLVHMGCNALRIKHMIDENEFEVSIIHESKVIAETCLMSMSLDLMIAYLTKMKEEFAE